MKRLIYYISMVTVLTVILSACGGQATPVVTEAPPTQPPATQPPATNPPATEAPATVAPIDLAGPPMEVGSKYQYVDGTILVAVPGGKFIMGYNNIGSKEHEVTLSDFWIYSTKVTNDQYARCVNAGQCTPPDPKTNPVFGDPTLINDPVVGVNYDQSAAYCTFVHGRLPTEAEWEKTARGPNANIFPWGDQSPSCGLSNYNFCLGKTTSVTNYPDGVSYYGAWDMAGNVREWTADWFSLEYFSDPAASLPDPRGPDTGQKRSVRGSSYQDSADFTIAAHRFSYNPAETLPDLGFRCVVEDPTYYAPFCVAPIVYGMMPNGGPSNDPIPSGACPTVSVNPVEDCKKNIVYVNISPNPLPAGSTVNAPATCTGSAPQLTCTGTGDVEVTAPTCNPAPPPGGGSCAFPYTKDGDTCKAQGKGSQCPTGSTFDAVNKCCSVQPGGSSEYNVCPAGFYQQGNACFPSKDYLSQGDKKSFSVDACVKRPGGDEPTGCTDPNGCPTTCTDPNGCATPPPTTCTNVTVCKPAGCVPSPTNRNCSCTTVCQ